MGDIPEQLGSLIRRFRLAGGLSQEQLAEKSGLSARAVSDLERGVRAHTRPETLRMLAEGLDLGDSDREALLHAARPELRQSSGTATIAHGPGNGLPIPPSALIGRDPQVAELVSRLSGGIGQLITLTGPGGVGKTRLALEAAHRAAPAFPEGTIFVDLAPVTDPNQVASALARALSIKESGRHSTRDALRIALLNRRLLLLLDNFEQVINAAPLVGELLAGAPDLRVLVTSREALRIRGEAEVVVEPLDLPTEREKYDLDALAHSPAVALFVQNAEPAKPGFALTEANVRAVVEICGRLDGLPLAIELAASRIRHFPPNILLDHLEQRLPVLTGGARDLPARQQTQRNTIAWSYDLLSPDEQALFRRVGVFPGGATIPAIESVVPAAGNLEIDLLSGLASLADKSLLRERMDRDGSPRFTMLELIREFALEQLAQTGEIEITRRALAGWNLEFVEAWVGDDSWIFLKSIDLQLIDEEIENIRDAFAYFSTVGDAESCARLLIRLFNYFYMRGRFKEASSLGYKMLELAEQHPISDRLHGLVLGDQTIFVTMLGKAPEGESHARKGLALLKRLSDNAVLVSGAMVQLAIAVREQGRYAEAMAYAEQAHDLAVTSGNLDLASFALYHVGKLAYLQDDLDRAKSCLDEALRQSSGPSWNETTLWSALYLAAVHTRRREPLAAAAMYREADRWWQETGSEFAALSLDFCGALAAGFRPVDAARLFGSEVTHTAAIGVSFEAEPWIAEVKRDLQEELGDEAYEAAFAEGQCLSLNDALALVRDVLDEIELGGTN
jgi:predicted ATPase/transcriptional regulator with XRE-family HTH domain